MDGSGALEIDKAGPEGLLHNWVAWFCWLSSLFGVVWYTLGFLEVTYLVERSWLPLCFSTAALGLFIINGAWFYVKQVPTVGAALQNGSVNAETAVDVRVTWTDRVFLITGLIICSVWFTVALTHYVRIDGKGESSVDYLIADPAADANLTTLIIQTMRRHNNLMLAGFFFSVILLVFGSIAWGLEAQTLAIYQISGGRNRRAGGKYQLGAGVSLAEQLKGSARV